MNKVDDGSGVVELYSGDKRQGRERERENPCTVVLYIFILWSVSAKSLCNMFKLSHILQP